MKDNYCISSSYCEAHEETYLKIKSKPSLFGSKVEHKMFEKVDSVLNKRYIKLPFGIRVLF